MMTLDDALGVFKAFELDLADQVVHATWGVAGEIGGFCRFTVDPLIPSTERITLTGVPGPHGKEWLFASIRGACPILSAAKLGRALHAAGCISRRFVEVAHV